MTDASIAAGEYREVQEGRLTDNRVVYPLAPFLTGKPLQRYVFLKRRYPHIRALDDELPRTFEQTQYCENLVAAHGSPVAARAVEKGNIAMLSWLRGLTHRDTDFGAAELFSKTVHHLRRDGYMALFVGSTDAGKTNTAILLCALYLRDNPDAHLIANLRDLEFGDDALDRRVHYADSTSEVVELAREYENTIALLDEMSTAANAQTNNYEVNENLAPLLTAKAKLGLRIIGIGHREDGRDLAPTVRQHTTHFVKQLRVHHDLDDDEYQAEFYREHDEDSFRDHVFTLKPIPPVSASYDPDEEQSFAVDE